ncbi:hypothetical protein [Natrinema salaciae]|uniref:Uncharacterized protein n=1 Tax=Natrinema salaciae TaxID=1186196 RepID=A0A1H9PVN1_9EURY|nr:hypothetical protein [Natrinema salaciae]SER52178.1 hypothetical protein SAMN04489841_3994 [Natrinema salaciae]
MPEQPISPFKYLWQFHYPFQYWDNRLEKINRYNEADKLEALYSLVQITDIYAHVFAAYAQNPEMPWFFVAEETYRGDIDNVLESLRTDGIATVGTLSEDLDGLATVEANEEFDINEMDAVAAGLLGCPHEIDPENVEFDFIEDPDLHRGVSNAILDFAENNVALLNDFKHGFRVLPVTPAQLRGMLGNQFQLREEQRDDFETQIDELEERLGEDEWGFSFIRLSTESTDYGYECSIDLYHVDAWACYKFAELTLNALYNLVTPQGGMPLEESLSEVPVPVLEGEEVLFDHIFGLAFPLRDDPETIVPEEEFRS